MIESLEYCDFVLHELVRATRALPRHDLDGVLSIATISGKLNLAANTKSKGLSESIAT